MTIAWWSFRYSRETLTEWHDEIIALQVICPAFVLDITTSILWFLQTFTRVTLENFFSIEFKLMGREFSSIHKPYRNWIIFCTVYLYKMTWEMTHKAMTIKSKQIQWLYENQPKLSGVAFASIGAKTSSTRIPYRSSFFDQERAILYLAQPVWTTVDPPP